MSKKTKAALADSYKKLLASTPLDKITITDITNDCGVNRMTFYYHFQDIFDLTTWMLMEDARKALEGLDYRDWEDGCLQIFNLVKKNDVLIMRVYDSSYRDALSRYLFKVIQGLIDIIVRDIAADMNIGETEINFIAKIYIYGFAGIVLEWISEGMKTDPEVLTRLIIKSIKSPMKQALESVSVKP